MVNYYVSTDGNNSSIDPTSSSTPYLTIIKAITTASNGDTIIVMDGTHTYLDTIVIDKEITLTSQNDNSNAILSKNSIGDFISIASDNVTISNLTIQSSAFNGADALISISRKSIGTIKPTKYSNITITGNNLKMFKYGIAINGGNITITNNSFSRNLNSTQKLTLFLVYYIRDTITISNNTHIDTGRTERFVYLTGAGTPTSTYYDRINSKGGSLIINTNTIDTSENTGQKPIMFIQDYYQTYTYGDGGNDDNYNSNTKLSITMDGNTMTGNSNILCDFFVPYLSNATNLNNYNSITLKNNTISHSNVGIVKMDASSAITIDSSIINLVYLFYIFNNTITNFLLRSDYTGDSSFTQNISKISPVNLYTLKNIKFISTVSPKSDQTITFNSLSAITYSQNGIINLSATSSSNLPITFTSSDPSVVEVFGSTLIMKSHGKSIITVSQIGDNNYNPALDVSQTQIVNLEEIVSSENEFLKEPITVSLNVHHPSVKTLEIIISKLEYITNNNISYGINTGYSGTISKISIIAKDENQNHITNFSENPIKLNLSLPHANPNNVLNLYKIDLETELIMDIQPSGFPKNLNYINNNIWETELVSLSKFIILDETPPSGVTGGDPHFQNIKNEFITLPNSWKYVKLYEYEKTKICAKCEFINNEIISKLHKFDFRKNLPIKINPNIDKYILKFTYFFEIDIYYENKLSLKIDTINSNILFDDRKYYIEKIQNRNGLFSIKKKKTYPTKNLISYYINLNNGDNLIVKTDNFWDDINEIQFFVNKDSYKNYSGELFEHSKINNLII